MEASCVWLLDSLRPCSASSLHSVLTRHRSRDDDFDLSDVLTFLPSKQHGELSRLLRAALAPSLLCVSEAAANGESTDHPDEKLAEHVAAARAGTEIVWTLVQQRKEPPIKELREVIFELHGVLLAMPTGAPQNLIAKICEWLWHSGDEEREDVVPQTMLYLLLKSFGAESEMLQQQEAKPPRAGGSSKDVARVYAMRKALDILELSESESQSETIRNLLLRCSTSAVYLRVDQGKKFLAYLLTLEDMREAMLQSLLNQIASVRKTRASYFGAVFLLAWKLEKSDWMFSTIMGIAEKAICAGTEPFATNLRTVLSSFHSNKRVAGVDNFLNRIYGAVLYKNLMVANARVRRNAVMIMADAFPIHDPNALMQDIEQAIGFQCGKLLDLLDDPAPIVRKATVEGTCRILGLLWELVPLASAKNMIDVITTKLAFDAASAQVRVAVFEGLEFLAHNHLAHQMLSFAMPRLRCLIHDNVERVRLSFLDLLVTLKSKRIRILRYFDVVPLEELLLRLPIESPAASTKIMSLILSSYFPLERKGKTADEIASSQVRACLSMLHTSQEACAHFYQNVNLHVPPGPLCEFAMRLSTIALDSPPDEGSLEGGEQTKAPPTRPSTRHTRRRSRRKPKDENDAPPHDNIVPEGDIPKAQKSGVAEPDRVTLLEIVAGVLASISPSLAKEGNRSLRKYIDNIFGGDALKSLLIERENTFQSRAVCWRIASCISHSQMTSISVIWREQLENVLAWPRRTDHERHNFEALLSALLLCGIRWNLVAPLSAILSGWADAATSGHRTARLGTKSIKKSRASKSQRGSRSGSRHPSEDHLYTTRCNALFALRSCASVFLGNSELQEEFGRLLSGSPSASDQDSGSQTSAVKLIRSVRKGSIGAIDFVLENHTDGSISEEERPAPHILLDCLALSWKLCLGLLCDGRVNESLFGELTELLQWASGRDLLRQASDMDVSFARALSCLILGYSADAVAIGCLNGSDVSFLESMAENVKSQVDLSDPRTVTRPVVEMLRISYQLGEHYLFEDTSAEERKESNLPLLETSQLLLSISCGILHACPVQDDYVTGRPRPLTLLDGFLSDAFAVKCHSEDSEAFRTVVGDLLRKSFENANKAEHNLLASTVCNIVTSSVTSPWKGMRLSAIQWHNLILFSLKPDEESTAPKKAIINYSSFLLTLVQSFYDDSETTPSDDARQFMASVEVLFNEQFPPDEIIPTEYAELPEVSEIRMCLTRLKKLCQPPDDTAASQREDKQGEDSLVDQKPKR